MKRLALLLLLGACSSTASPPVFDGPCATDMTATWNLRGAPDRQVRTPQGTQITVEWTYPRIVEIFIWNTASPAFCMRGQAVP